MDKVRCLFIECFNLLQIPSQVQAVVLCCPSCQGGAVCSSRALGNHAFRTCLDQANSLQGKDCTKELRDTSSSPSPSSTEGTGASGRASSVHRWKWCSRIAEESLETACSLLPRCGSKALGPGLQPRESCRVSCSEAGPWQAQPRAGSTRARSCQELLFGNGLVFFVSFPHEAFPDTRGSILPAISHVLACDSEQGEVLQKTTRAAKGGRRKHPGPSRPRSVQALPKPLVPNSPGERGRARNKERTGIGLRCIPAKAAGCAAGPTCACPGTPGTRLPRPGLPAALSLDPRVSADPARCCPPGWPVFPGSGERVCALSWFSGVKKYFPLIPVPDEQAQAAGPPRPPLSTAPRPRFSRGASTRVARGDGPVASVGAGLGAGRDAALRLQGLTREGGGGPSALLCSAPPGPRSRCRQQTPAGAVPFTTSLPAQALGGAASCLFPAPLSRPCPGRLQPPAPRCPPRLLAGCAAHRGAGPIAAPAPLARNAVCTRGPGRQPRAAARLAAEGAGGGILARRSRGGAAPGQEPAKTGGAGAWGGSTAAPGAGAEQPSRAEPSRAELIRAEPRRPALPVPSRPVRPRPGPVPARRGHGGGVRRPARPARPLLPARGRREALGPALGRPAPAHGAVRALRRCLPAGGVRLQAGARAVPGGRRLGGGGGGAAAGRRAAAAAGAQQLRAHRRHDRCHLHAAGAEGARGHVRPRRRLPRPAAAAQRPRPGGPRQGQVRVTAGAALPAGVTPWGRRGDGVAPREALCSQRAVPEPPRLFPRLGRAGGRLRSRGGFLFLNKASVFHVSPPVLRAPAARDGV
ncbi:transmembrane protein 35B isoform X2 [Dromaius novaehollandiae]|uniref:transmembrane protein 35B isoform X2 n=1 Tax=Dromaius novaehollandiae TaxID=8790 RepID=UPI00311E47E4